MNDYDDDYHSEVDEEEWIPPSVRMDQEESRLRHRIRMLERENEELSRKLSKALGDLCGALDRSAHRQLLLGMAGKLPGCEIE